VSQLTLKIFVHEGGKAPKKGKAGDAGLDCFAWLPAVPTVPYGSTRDHAWMVGPGGVAKIGLGFSYSFWVYGEVSHNYFLDIRNRSGVGTKSGFVTVAEVGDANYRGMIHYCVAKCIPGEYGVAHGDKIAQAIITPFLDPHTVTLQVVSTLEELGPSERGADGFGSSGT